MTSKEDFMSLWGKNPGAKPQASVIGGLQRQIAERDKEIEKLNQQLTTMKTRLSEDVKTLEESEKTISSQAALIQDLKTQAYGKGGAPAASVGANGKAPPDKLSTLSENKQLKNTVKELQEKIYVFSNLPDRISELEKKNESLTRLIDKYEADQKRLTETIRKLSIGAGAEDVVLNLQEEARKQDEKIKLLQIQLEAAKEQAMIPTETSGTHDTEIKQMKQRVAKLTSDLNSAKLLADEERGKRIEFEAKYDIIKKTMESGKQIGLQSANKSNLESEIQQRIAKINDLEGKVQKLETNMTNNEKITADIQEKKFSLEKENAALREKVASVEEKYKDATARFENMVADKSKDGKKKDAGISFADAEINSLRTKVKDLTTEIEKIKDSAASEPPEPLSTLVTDLQSKLSATKALLAGKEAQVKELEIKLREYAVKEANH